MTQLRKEKRLNLHELRLSGTAVTATADELNALAGSGASVASGTQQASIADVAVTGTYATDDTPIETAINSIIAVLVEFGMIAAAE
jgi:hypothetical protein